MADLPRDLSRPDLWATSIERSLHRRQRPRRSSIELWALREPRDLTDVGVLIDSLHHARARRAAAERAAGLPPGAVRGLSVLGVLAVTATPTAASLAASHDSGQGLTSTSLPDSEGVGSLQRQLGVASDGVFGAGTERAVRRFQADRGLASDGVVGAATRAALGLVPGPQLRQSVAPAGTQATAASAATPAGAPGATGVAGLQARLGVSTDGDFGPLTAGAVRRYQEAHGLTSDGVVGPATRAALGLGDGPQLVESPRYMPVAANAGADAQGVSARPHTEAVASAVRAAPRAGGGVRALQAALGLSPDGDFGSQTAAAVRGYQRAHGLTPDGIVGPSTRGALGLGAGPVLRGAPPAAAASTSSPGSTTTQSGSSAPSSVSEMVAAGDQIANRPYVYGGGHGSFTSDGYDCSGSVSYVLHAAGLLSSPEDSSALESYGAPGPGQHVTIYANAGHAWMTIDGRRFDTVALQETGSRWTSASGDASGYVVRHPVGM